MSARPHETSPDKPPGGVVFGGSSGVGAAVTADLVEQGQRVVVASRRGTLPAGVSKTEGVVAVSCDVTAPADVRAAIGSAHELGSLDWVVNSVGVGYFAPVEPCYHEQWKNILDVNVTGLLNILASVREVRPPVSHFVHISSLSAHRPSRTPGNDVYAAAKSAAAGLLYRERAHLRGSGVPTKITLVTPGFIGETEFATNFFRYAPDQARPLLGDFPPLVPCDIAQSVLWAIASPPNVEISEITLRPLWQPD